MHTLTNQVLTFYCACQLCCGPNAANKTAAGTRPVAGRTIAAPRSIPLGVSVYVNRRWYTVEDRLSKRMPSNRWDIFVDSHAEALRLGKQANVTIKWAP